MEKSKESDRVFQLHITEAGPGMVDFQQEETALPIKVSKRCEEVLDSLLLPWKYTTKEFLLNLLPLRRKQMWAAALYPEEYRLSGHVVSIRKKPDDFAFGSYSLGRGEFSIDDGVPPFSFMLIKNKAVLADAAERSPIFAQAWELLKDKEEDRYWVCLPSAPPEEWVEKMVSNNDKLFNRRIREMPPIQPVKTATSPRKIVARLFPSVGGELPIRGGWGYSKEDACIIDKNDPVVEGKMAFDLIGLEYLFVEKRIYTEMIIFRPDNGRFSGIEWKLKRQELIKEDGRVFDRLIFEITAFTDKDWEKLKEDYEKRGGLKTEEDIMCHEQMRREKMVRLTREFWFDITSCFEK